MRLTVVLFGRAPVLGELTKMYANLPESYMKRCLEHVEWRTPRGLPQYLPRDVVRHKRHLGVHRPWSPPFQKENEFGRPRPKVFVEPLREWSYFKGDRVEILSGVDKGKQGIVAQVIQERNWVVVEGLNCKPKLIGKSEDYPGTVMLVEQPLVVNREVALVDPADLLATLVEWRFTQEGEKVRVSARTGRLVPIPKQAQETYDYKSKSTYKESPKDTPSKQLSAISFSPLLKTFEMDIMDQMGIKEDRIPIKTYWY